MKMEQYSCYNTFFTYIKENGRRKKLNKYLGKCLGGCYIYIYIYIYIWFFQRCYYYFHIKIIRKSFRFRSLSNVKKPVILTLTL